MSQNQLAGSELLQTIKVSGIFMQKYKTICNRINQLAISVSTLLCAQLRMFWLPTATTKYVKNSRIYVVGFQLRRFSRCTFLLVN